MLVELNELPKCNCGVVFPEDVQLNNHIQENKQCRLVLKQLIRFAYTQLGRLLCHSRAQDVDDDAEDPLCKKHKDEGGVFYCPMWGCDFRGEKPYQLKKHFGRHIPLYNEPQCVFCGHQAQTVGEYLDHAKLHASDSIDSEAKRVYQSSRCEELRTIRDEQLALSMPKIKRPSAPRRKNKRKRTSAQVRSSREAQSIVDTGMSQPDLRTHIQGDLSLSSQLGLVAPPHSTSLSSTSSSAQCSSSLVEPGQPANQNALSASGAAMVHLNSRRSAPDIGLGLQLHENVELEELEGNAFMTGVNSHFQSTDSLSQIGPEPPSAPNGIGSDMTMSRHNSRMPTQRIDPQSQFDSGPLTTQRTNYGNANANIPDSSIPPLSATTQYVNIAVDHLSGMGTHYTNFGRIVGTQNFPFH